MRRLYNDEDVVRFAKRLHPKGAFGFQCTLERVIEELKSCSDFAIHRVIFLVYVVLIHCIDIITVYVQRIEIRSMQANV